MEAARCIEKEDWLGNQRFLDDGVPTSTSEQQEDVEKLVDNKFAMYRARIKNLAPEDKGPVLERFKHLAYLNKGLCYLSESYEVLDASRPWLCYWIVHSLELLGEKFTPEQSSSIAQFLGQCQCPDGGFAGGPGQIAHLAPTYAAVLALSTLGTEEAYNIIDRPKLQSYLMRMKTQEGAFLMHNSGEVDVRGAYCAAVSAILTNVATPDLFDGTPEWIVSCQTYEGGFAGQPGMEAHGGYTFCSVAALVLLGHERLCDVQGLLRWLAMRQMRFEGGFQGRTNKLVDGCYSFWQAGVFPLVHSILTKQEDTALSMDSWMFDQKALQEYVLLCCQNNHGGLIDKPGKARDFYHTCYCLSGLSVAQHFLAGQLREDDVAGDPKNELRPTHPVFNISLQCAHNASHYFGKLPIPTLR